MAPPSMAPPSSAPPSVFEGHDASGLAASEIGASADGRAVPEEHAQAASAAAATTRTPSDLTTTCSPISTEHLGRGGWSDRARPDNRYARPRRARRTNANTAE